MKTHLYRSIAFVLLALFFAQSSFATCGGGGGGGGGGTSNNGGGGGANPPVYRVPWEITPKVNPSGLVLYWFPEHLKYLIQIFDPISQFLRNKPADRWLLYGAFYTLAVVIMGIRALLKYRHSNYQSTKGYHR